MIEKPKHLIVDCSTGETIEKELTDDEMVIYQKRLIERAEEEKQRLAVLEAKAEAKTSALAKLAALGLTEEEANALVD